MVTDIKAERRARVKERLPDIVGRLNYYLKGENLHTIQPVLTRIGRNGVNPHWYDRLANENVLPNLDGKTVGSVVEMLFLADIETVIFPDEKVEFRVNPASGVDLPDLDLGIKSPSENWCTSEPFTHAYERILGTEYDVVALITNYQSAKSSPPLKLQIINSRFLEKTEVADKGLCKKALKLRQLMNLVEEPSAQKALRFIAYVNQSNWLCKQILKAFDVLSNEQHIQESIKMSIEKYDKDIAKTENANPAYRDKLTSCLQEKPLWKAVIGMADDWIIESWRNTAQMPGHLDWERFQMSPLNGKLGVSFALQWRYNFGAMFKKLSDHEVEANDASNLG